MLIPSVWIAGGATNVSLCSVAALVVASDARGLRVVAVQCGGL
jgi:hypothetical protein